MNASIGQQLGVYEIKEVLGTGGMAVVYRAVQTNLQRDVAIKVIKPDLVNQHDLIQRIEHEAKIIASLSHPHILKLFDYGKHENRVYLVVEFLPGGNLAQLIRHQPLPLSKSAAILNDIADALDYAHSKECIHRDLKPQNILFDAQEHIYLTDFGIAKVLSESISLTHSGKIAGTPFYMAPEQWQGETLG